MTRAKAEAVAALRSDGHDLGHLLACSGLARSHAIYALARTRPGRPGPELRGAVAEIFSRTANGCGHRQVAMCLRAELGRARVADKTMLKMMREMGIRCGIRRETDYHRVQLITGAPSAETLRERHRARLLRRRAVAEDGHRRHGVQAALG